MRTRVERGEALVSLRKLRDESFDALITDPPYSSGGMFRGDKAKDPVSKYEQSDVRVSRSSFTGDNRDTRSWAFWMTLWLTEAHRIIRPRGYALVFCDWRQLPTLTDTMQAGGFVWRGVIAWDKGLGARAPHKGYFRHQCEYIAWGTKGAAPQPEHGGPFPGCIHASVRQADKFHLAGKPTELMRELVRAVPPRGLVLDPFAGSGTTLVAAALEGRRGLGFDLERENVRVANGRIEEARRARRRLARRAA